MKPELEQLLRTKHPKIFAEWDESNTDADADATMSKGIECGDGWFELIDMLCLILQIMTNTEGAPQAVAVRVKEKSGRLQFCVRDKLSEPQMERIQRIADMSAEQCEECGKPGTTLKLRPGHMVTRCVAHVPESTNE